jgi:hypothetical protein
MAFAPAKLSLSVTGTKTLLMSFLKPCRPSITASWTGTLTSLILAVFFTSGPATAQEGKVVRSIDVQYVGNQTVAPDRIRSQMSTKVGTPSPWPRSTKT